MFFSVSAVYRRQQQRDRDEPLPPIDDDGAAILLTPHVHDASRVMIHPAALGGHEVLK